ncbi:alpha/beta hydrolase family protein [Actinoplanes subtropicus]|uniref:alpha/beta hydrolase family protein n=1 Tax=Actinoplanes subtropicus TaxID=543632 RepID=UPI00068BA03E|nr:alpha/beta hydrolase [Actinoplanes subtropicus]
MYDDGVPPSRPTTSAPPSSPAAPHQAPSRIFPVKTERLSLARGADRPLPTTIWRPTTAGTYPLILFSHGLETTPADYRELLTTWAKAGFVVAAPTYPHTAAGVADFNPVDLLYQPLDAEYVITQVAKRLGPVGPIAAAGHSGGGVTTLGMFSGNRDERLKAGVIMAGRQIITTPLSGPSAPLLFVHGKRDQVIDYADGHAVYAAVTWPKAFLTVTDGGHVPTGAELAVVATTSTDLLRWSLYGDAAAKKRLPRDATRGNLAALEDRL